MTRISAGNTLTNQYAPPFVVSDSVQNNWELRWSADLIAFEAFDPSENVIAAGFDSIQQQVFSNVINQQVFVVPWGVAISSPYNPPSDNASLYITINGVKQHSNTFIISAGTNTTSITLGGPVTGDVEVIGMQTTGGATVNLANLTPDGTNKTFSIGWLAPSEQSLLVTIDGIRQHTDTYSIESITNFTDTNIIFSAAPGAQIISAVVVDGGTGYTVGDLLTVELGGGASTADAVLRVDTAPGGAVSTVTVIFGGVYSILPSNPVNVTGGTGGDDATFNLTVDANIEVVGITTTGEIPASPVDAANIFGLDTAEVFGLFASKTLTGEIQILNFKSLEEGNNVTITDNTNRLTIDVTQPTFQNLGSGTGIAVDPNVTSPLQLRVLKTKLEADTAEGGLTIVIDTADDDAISIVRNFGYLLTSSNDYNMDSTFVGERIIGLNNFTTTKTVTLPPIASIRAGETITIKDEIGGASATFTVTIDTVGAELIDTVGSIIGINSAFGYITLYSNGTNYFIIAQG